MKITCLRCSGKITLAWPRALSQDRQPDARLRGLCPRRGSARPCRTAAALAGHLAAHPRAGVTGAGPAQFDLFAAITKHHWPHDPLTWTGEGALGSGVVAV